MIYLGVIGGYGPVDMSYEGLTLSFDASSANVRSHTSVPIGSADADRTVFIIAHWAVSSVGAALVSATIGGVVATIHVQTNDATRGAAIISAPLAAGATTTVVLTLTSALAGYSSSVASFKATSLISSTAYDTDSAIAASVTTQAVTLDLKGDGILLAAASLSSLAAAYGISGATELYESMPAYVGGGDEITADELARVVTFSRSGGSGTDFNGAVVAASFR